MPATTSVSVVGLGAMGTALAGALLAAGHPTTVWNRTPAKADPLVERGAWRADSFAEAVAVTDVVVICVLANDNVSDLITGAEENLRGRVVVNLTNGSPDEARALADRVTALGARYLDGGIMAVPAMIATPGAVVLYSGSAEAFEAHRDVLGVFGRAVHLGEDAGFAALHDLALLTGMYGMFGGFTHAAALVRSAGVKVEEFTTELLVPWLHAMTGIMPAMAARMDTGDYSTTGSNLAMQVPVGHTIGNLSRAQGVSDELFAPYRDLMLRRVADGHGDEDMAGVVELLFTR